MPPRSLRRRLPAAALAAILFLPTLPAGDLLTWLGRTFTGLWTEASAPGESPGAVNPDPLDGGPEGDTGPLIDPDG